MKNFTLSRFSIAADLDISNLFVTDDSINVDKDIKEINAELEPWIRLSYELIATEHLMRASAFIICCGGQNKIKQKLFIDYYGLVDEQTKVIEECIPTDGYKTMCINEKKEMKETRQNTVKLVYD
jgi:hypothetical protein